VTIEFLPDETAEEPPPPLPARRRRWWPAVAVLGAGAIVAWSLTRPPAHHHVPPRTSQHARTALSKPVPGCAGVPDCGVRDGVPVAITQLVRTYLAGAAKVRVHTIVAVNSLTLTDLLVERDIDVVSGSVTVLIRVQRGVDVSREIVHAPPGTGSLLLHHIASGYIVRLQYLAPETVPPMLDRLRQLTRDPRLESL
jgi:hypothetical protein